MTSWVTDRSSAAGAALAFYCAFSLAPLLIILLAVAGWIVGAEAAYGQLSNTLTQLFGQPTAKVRILSFGVILAVGRPGACRGDRC